MRVYKNFDLTNFNSYRLNAFCATAYFPDNEDDVLNIFMNRNCRKIILGNGNNIILSKKWYKEDFIIFSDCFNRFEVNSNEITAEAGTTMLQLSETALEHALSGFEIFYDIPSSVGGAVVMNAGASGEEIKDFAIKVRYMDLSDMKIKEITPIEMEFEYRNSYFQKNRDKIVLKAWFLLTSGNPAAIKTKMEEIKQKRWTKQPRNYPNCGSVFKRPKNFYVGTIIEKLGLKGLIIGGAQISEKHAGFIINTGNAKGEDILKIIEIVKKRAKSELDVDLVLEQQII